MCSTPTTWLAYHRAPLHWSGIWIKDQTAFIASVLWRPFWIFNTRARSASARSGTEIKKIARSHLGALTCHFIIFGERSDPTGICESQSSKTSFPDLALADRPRIKNSKWPPQNKREVFCSYSKRMRQLPVAYLSTGSLRVFHQISLLENQILGKYLPWLISNCLLLLLTVNLCKILVYRSL